MHIYKLSNEQLAQILIPKRFVPSTPEEYKDNNIVYVFDSEDKFELTYDELVEIIGKARQAGPRMVPVLGEVN